MIILAKQGGQSPKTLTFALVEPQHIFEQVKRFTDGYNGSHSSCFRLKVLSFDGIPVANLDELVQLIPRLIEKKHFNMQYVNHLPVQFALNFLLLGQDTYKANITYDEHSPEPRLFTWDPIQLAWNSDPIPLVSGATH